MANNINWEEFRRQLESELSGTIEFDLQDFHFARFAMGSGSVAYSIKGKIIKIDFDGRDDKISIKVSSPHSKYGDPATTYSEVATFYELNSCCKEVADFIQQL